MAILEQVAIGLIQRDFMDIATQVQAEFKAEVHRSLKHPEYSSGQAEGSISIRQESADRILVGSEDQHLNFMIRGNGGGQKTPFKKSHPRAPMPITYGARATIGKNTPFRMSSTSYAGRPEILTRVADKFR